jgi:PhnB protein
MQTVGETPVAGQMPPEAQNKIMHASLTKDSLALMASDMMGEDGLVKGNTISLLLIETWFSKLSKGGKVDHPLKEEFWGSVFGDLTGKFGMLWMLNWDKPKA